jgi:hypothetical protein
MFENPRYWLSLNGTQQIDTRFVSFVTPLAEAAGFLPTKRLKSTFRLADTAC